MRGTKVLGGGGMVSGTTVFDGRMKRAHWTHAMTVGQSGGIAAGFRGDFGYAPGNFGVMQPNRWANFEIAQFSAISTEQVELEFVSNPGVQIPGVDEILIGVDGWGVINLPWNPGNSAYLLNITGFLAFLQSRLGGVVGLRFGKAGLPILATNRMTVGESGTLRGFRPADHPTSQFGSMDPDTYGGYRIWQLSGGTGDPQNYQLRLASLDGLQQNVQLGNAEQIDLYLAGYGTKRLTWEPGAGRYLYLANPTTENIYEFLGSNLGQVVDVAISPA